MARNALPLLLAALALTVVVPAAAAVEVPAPGSLLYLQTNGPANPVGNGDWYAAAVPGAGRGHSYASFTIPCGWPPARPVHVDLFSPEMNADAAVLARTEEPVGALDPAEFELYGPGVPVGPGSASPAPGTGRPGARTTYPPTPRGVPERWVRFATLAPAACGTYVVRASVTGAGNDQNGWRLRIGADDDTSPTNAPPATSDDADGVPGTDDELVVGLNQLTYQHDSPGTPCQTLFEYVQPGQASVRFHNFDMDDAGRVRYYPPSATLDPTATTGGIAGTVSGLTRWNRSAGLSRVGDEVLDPEPGWWRLVTCITRQNQYIFEGQSTARLFYEQPATPRLEIGVDDGRTQVAPGEEVEYAVVVRNTSSGPTAGSANGVTVVTTLPPGATLLGCTVVAPRTGTCTAEGERATVRLDGSLDAGEAAAVTLRVRQPSDPASPDLTLTTGATYRDALGNAYPPPSASDVDVVVLPAPPAPTPPAPAPPAPAPPAPPATAQDVVAQGTGADLALTKSAPATARLGAPLTYTLVVTNAGPQTARAVTLTDRLSRRVRLRDVRTTAGTCTGRSTIRCAIGDLAAGAAATVSVRVVPVRTGPLTNGASVASGSEDPSGGDATAQARGRVEAAPARLRLTKRPSRSRVREGGSVTWTLRVRNVGREAAGDVTVCDVLPRRLVVLAAPRARYRGGRPCWSFAYLRPGEERTVRIRTRVARGGPAGSLRNRATAQSPGADPVRVTSVVTVVAGPAPSDGGVTG